jgi:hypothetical protein
MLEKMNVIKRDGTRQPLDISKIHAVLDWACSGSGDGSLAPIKGVSTSDIEMRAQLQLHEGIRTKDIHGLLIKAAESLISEDTPNYDWAAARLRWFAVRKDAFGSNLPPHLKTVIAQNIANNVYDPAIAGMYSDDYPEVAERGDQVIAVLIKEEKAFRQTLRKGEEKRYVAGGFGRSEDHLVKRDGKWLIDSRKLVVFTD